MRKILLALLIIIIFSSSSFSSTITFTDNSNNEDGFKIYRAITALSAFIQISTIASNITIFVDDNAISGNCYRVTAFNSVGESQPSNIACLPQAVIVIPLSPSGTGVVP